MIYLQFIAFIVLDHFIIQDKTCRLTVVIYLIRLIANL
jgi:hypothetical protein